MHFSLSITMRAFGMLPDARMGALTTWDYCTSTTRISSRVYSDCAITISAMIAQTGKPEFDQEGMMAKGVIIRHMVLPGCRKDSSALLRWMKEKLPEGSFLLSLLSQYTPFYKSSQYPEIHRRLTSYEYNKVLDEAISLGLTQGFMQEKSSAKEEYTPPFNFEGL